MFVGGWGGSWEGRARAGHEGVRGVKGGGEVCVCACVCVCGVCVCVCERERERERE